MTHHEGSSTAHRSTLLRAAILWALALPLGACNPNLDIDGALVPAWVTAGALGIAGMVCARVVLVRTGIDRHLVARPAVYLSLGITFTCVVWIAVFRY